MLRLVNLFAKSLRSCVLALCVGKLAEACKTKELQCYDRRLSVLAIVGGVGKCEASGRVGGLAGVIKNLYQAHKNLYQAQNNCNCVFFPCRKFPHCSAIASAKNWLVMLLLCPLDFPFT